MTALSVQQPWAWAIVAGHKEIENRTWPTHFRGLLHIHAGLSTKRLGDMADDYLEFSGVVEPEASTLVFGAILGTVEVIGCHELLKLPAIHADNPYAEGPWCWLLDNAVIFDKPIPCRGMQGLFRPNVEL